jgi:hypothetical protein
MHIHRSQPSVTDTYFTTDNCTTERAPFPVISTPTTLRKSFRRVLTLSSGLRVRMRTLLVPQLLPPRSPCEVQEDHEGEDERRIVLCVEVENTVEGELSHGFEVEGVVVEVGGKGGRATAEMVCAPQPRSEGIKEAFPLLLRPVEQYNLLYAVDIAAAENRDGGVDRAVAKSMGRGDEQRPVSITVIGRPYIMSDREASSGDGLHGGHKVYPTHTFHSRWNCTLDLAPFYASLNTETASRPHLLNKPFVLQNGAVPASPPNGIAGDKRYSIATLLTNRSSPPGSGVPSQNLHGPSHGSNQDRRVLSGRQERPAMPSQLSVRPERIASLRSVHDQSLADSGLLVSVKVLSQPLSRSGSKLPSSASVGGPETGPIGQGTIRVMEPFTVEVFVHNRTDAVRRFRLTVQEKAVGGLAGEMISKRRGRKSGEPTWGMEDPSELVPLHIHSHGATRYC